MLFRRRLIWKLIPVYVLVVVACTAGVAWYVGHEVGRMFRDQLESSMTHAVQILRPTAADLIASGHTDRLQPLVEQLSGLTGHRITIIAADGLVLGDSQADPARMDNHATRPEVSQAMRGGLGRAERYSGTVHTRLLYIAAPLYEVDGKQPIGVVRLAVPMTLVVAQTRRVQTTVVLGGSVLAVLIALTTAWIFQQHVAKPLYEMQVGARQMARGELSQALRVPDSVEIGSLAEALNRMGQQLNQKIQMISEQASEQEAVLASMAEGVMAIDIERQIISMNTAAARLFGLDTVQSLGHGVEEVIRNADLLRFLNETLRSDRPVEREIVLPSLPGALPGTLPGAIPGAGLGGGKDKEKVIQAHGSALRDTERQRLGAVIVFNDITRLRQLESVRQQFVANVSHELKTPISAIKAAVETLTDAMGPLMDEAESSDAAFAAKRFLPMIGRQAERLNAIVDDLLTLARLEQEKQDEPVRMERKPLLPVLRGAIETCQAKADGKQMKIDLAITPDLQARINETLLVQAVVNLLDNAIKYSPAGRPIALSSEQRNGEVIITVTDKGPGIEPEHLPRLFERFYRTDKARSRDMGGTGLGLAIVKHVAQTHHGTVSVDSKPGQGSTFRIHLPVA